MSDTTFGILALGNYVPRGRLPKQVVANANSWFDPSLKRGLGQRRSFCNWDEDALTMGVEAARACVAGVDRTDIDVIEFASTTLPFADRSNVGVLREAVDLPDTPNLTDSGGSLRAASSALSRSLQRRSGRSLLVASDCVDPKPASPEEAATGHAASAVLIGEGEPLARLVGSATKHQDFVDHYRLASEKFAYTLEARWTRDAGYRQPVSEVFQAALADAGISEDAVSRLAVAAPAPLAKTIAKDLRQDDAGFAVQQRIGYCGAAHPLLLLSRLLACSAPGDIVGLVSVGQGIDVQLFAVAGQAERASLEGALDGGVEETNYSRYLTLRGLLTISEGIRAERDNRTAQSAFWRKHEELTGFKGGECSACGTLQFPPSKVCVSCGAQDSQTLRRIADMPGRVRSFTEDWLAYTQKPPLVFGNVGFSGNANVMMEFTDVEPGQLAIGMPVDLRFRIKDIDARRGFRRYFWKPTVREGQANG
ncbi:MAG: zinc ribbon domain-containing protein [Pseudomonadota bacterium]